MILLRDNIFESVFEIIRSKLLVNFTEDLLFFLIEGDVCFSGEVFEKEDIVSDVAFDIRSIKLRFQYARTDAQYGDRGSHAF